MVYYFRIVVGIMKSEAKEIDGEGTPGVEYVLDIWKLDNRIIEFESSL